MCNYFVSQDVPQDLCVSASRNDMSEMNEMHDRALEEKIRALEEKHALEEANRAGKSSKRIHARDCM
jgi:hypothetical protein